MKFWIFAVTILQFVSVAHSAEDYQEVFPKVKIEYPVFLEFFSSYAKEQKLKPLQPDHLRFFVQPLGIMDSVCDVDLKSGAYTRYPGTHDKEGIQKGKLSDQDLASLVSLIASKAFQELPEQILKMGLDGCTYFVEADWKGRYSWRLRWEPDEPAFKKIEKLLKKAVKPAEALRPPNGL